MLIVFKYRSREFILPVTNSITFEDVKSALPEGAAIKGYFDDEMLKDMAYYKFIKEDLYTVDISAETIRKRKETDDNVIFMLFEINARGRSNFKSYRGYKVEPIKSR